MTITERLHLCLLKNGIHYAKHECYKKVEEIKIHRRPMSKCRVSLSTLISEH